MDIDVSGLNKLKFYFIGILGSGMFPLAKYVKQCGAEVSGSDRSYKEEKKDEIAALTGNLFIKLYYQNGMHLTEDIDFAVTSSAIENSNSDLQTANRLNIPVIHRTDLLSSIFNSKYGIAVAGTSGKSTVTGMLGFILQNMEIYPDMINGAVVKDIKGKDKSSDILYNRSDKFIIETDESDGSIVKYEPKIGILLNITKDHKTLEELKLLFQKFVDNIEEKIIVNVEDYNVMRLNYNGKKVVTFGRGEEAEYKINSIELEKNKSYFKINENEFNLKTGGIHNIYNAAAAITVCFEMGLEYESIKNAVSSFKGVKGRLDFRGLVNNTEFFWDFAHNPAKIEALLKYLNSIYKSYIFVYQPHGYQPTYFTKNELITVFKENFKNNSRLIVLPVYYAGGTAEKNITSQNITDILNEEGIKTYYFDTREETSRYIIDSYDRFNAVVLAGARDNTLPVFLDNCINNIRDK